MIWSKCNLTTQSLKYKLIQFCLFQNCHIGGVIQRIAFTDWIHSLNNTHLSSLHVFSLLDSSILFTEEYPIRYTTAYLAIHQHPCMQVPAIMNEVAVNILVKVFQLLWANIKQHNNFKNYCHILKFYS